ncbi:sugar phosphate isomerase/epimerase family protein [Niveibacterium sp.]|uniref:sugar phosphate isomerase/epimerase family protein n=1 Tax=Niveibacterium sp. TaxID=2017444 RepID=UPI0035B312C3
MRVAASALAWDLEEDAAVAAMLRRLEIDAVDLVPGKYFPDIERVGAAEIREVKAWWSDRGFEITGMQALLFGAQGMNVFGDADSRERLLQRLGAVARIGSGLGARRLVFGSPRNRDRGGLPTEEALSIASEFFYRLGEVAQREGVLFCLEPNPAVYTCNFMVDSFETADVVRRVGHPSIRMQIDTGAIAINGESIEQVIAMHGELVGHIHISEPHLVPIGDGKVDHDMMAACFARRFPEALVCIEMLAAKQESHLTALERACIRVNETYKGCGNA